MVPNHQPVGDLVCDRWFGMWFLDLELQPKFWTSNVVLTGWKKHSQWCYDEDYIFSEGASLDPLWQTKWSQVVFSASKTRLGGADHLAKPRPTWPHRPSNSIGLRRWMCWSLSAWRWGCTGCTQKWSLHWILSMFLDILITKNNWKTTKIHLKLQTTLHLSSFSIHSNHSI